MRLEMLGEMIDPGGQQCDLHLSRTGVTFMQLVLFNNLPLCVFRNRHTSRYLPSTTAMPLHGHAVSSTLCL
jgi:hypothetical protein